MDESRRISCWGYNVDSIQAQTITALGFEIGGFEEKNVSDNADLLFDLLNIDPDPVKYYKCKYKQWIFEATHLRKDNFPQGILQVKQINDTTNGKFYKVDVNLFDINISKYSSTNFLRILELGMEYIIDEKFRKYKMIPEELAKKGLRVKKIKWLYDQLEPGQQTLELSKSESDKSTIVYIHFSGDDKMEIEVSECLVYGKCHQAKSLAIYKFDMKPTDDSFYGELMKCIECVFIHLSGNYGYFENDRFYTGNDLISYWEATILSEDFRNKFIFDSAETKNNLYEGPDLNIYLNYTFRSADGERTLKYTKQPMGGSDYNYIYESHTIQLIYDKKKDPTNCHLTITAEFLDYWVKTEEATILELIYQKELKDTYLSLCKTIVSHISTQIEKNDKSNGLPSFSDDEDSAVSSIINKYMGDSDSDDVDSIWNLDKRLSKLQE